MQFTFPCGYILYESSVFLCSYSPRKTSKFSCSEIAFKVILGWISATINNEFVHLKLHFTWYMHAILKAYSYIG